ncbi:phage holin family protein [Bacillus sp. B-jedd]|uniref:phage holin family protein n=1 Tax=Bacillus sp. B-jedd TaxID=1476857 RepID=UPI00051556A0|nr:phage holin family protein [Bacillus sp. B-jedd]CEG26021.1 putative prophage LambdaBa01, holin [Bacillus sp. B-jedd]
MEKWEAVYKFGFTTVGGVFGYLFGGWSPLLQILLAFVIIDYLTGLIASGTEGKLSSKIGFRGIAKKVMIFCLIAVAHLVDRALGDGNMVRDALIFFYLGNELLSIIENAGRTGLPVPDQIKSAVDVLKGRVSK